jgi:hypothetical protein
MNQAGFFLLNSPPVGSMNQAGFPLLNSPPVGSSL